MKKRHILAYHKNTLTKACIDTVCIFTILIIFMESRVSLK